MAATLKVIVAGFATFVEEFLEEESVKEEEDVLEEFLPLFYANNLLSERHKAVRIEGYAETVVLSNSYKSAILDMAGDASNVKGS